MATDDGLGIFYTDYERTEEEFLAALDESLGARGPDMLYDLVGEFGLPAGATAVDVGCGEGRQAILLAERFGLSVTGVDPLWNHLDEARAQLASSARRTPALATRVGFEQGRAEALAFPNASVDLVWCKDVLVHVVELERVYQEFHRVLRPQGRALVYQSCFATGRLAPTEAKEVWSVGFVRENADPARTDAAISASGLRVVDRIDVGLEWGEHAQEHTGKAGRRLLHVARLLREPERYKARFGSRAYNIMLGDCLWHVYRLLGKMEERVYVLSK